MRNLEPIVLTVALALLALVAAGLAYTFPSIEDLTTITSVEPDGHQAKATMERGRPDQAACSLDHPGRRGMSPPTRRGSSSPTAISSTPSLYPSGNYIQKDDGNRDHSRAASSSAGCQKYNLDITDPNIDREDRGQGRLLQQDRIFRGPADRARAKADGSKSTSPIDPKLRTRPTCRGCDCKTSTCSPSISSSSAWSASRARTSSRSR